MSAAAAPAPGPTTPDTLTRLADAMTRHDVPLEGSHVTWRTRGEGPPLVLLHGGHGSWAHWVRNIEPLSRRFRVLVPDLPGYGDSSAPAAPTLEALVDATQHTLDTLVGAGAPVALAGFSFGGLVATHLAARRGGVSHLALLGPAGHGGARRPRAALRDWREAAAQRQDDALRDLMRHNLQAHMLAGPADDLALAVHTMSCLRTRFHSKRISRAGGLAEPLRTVNAPVVLLWGEHDVTATPAELAPVLAGVCAAVVHTEILPDAGHWVQYEAADTVNTLLAGWLQAGG